MNRPTILEAVRDAIHAVAPEADLATLPPDARLREALDLDSIDFLHVVMKLHDTLGIDVPETDYERLSTLDGFVSYLTERSTARSERAAESS